MIYSIEEIKKAVIPVAEKYGLKSVFLFGSYARNEATENSDIDLLIDTAGTNIKGLFALGAVYCDLSDALGKQIDLITISSIDQKSNIPSDELFRENVLRERVNIYAVA